MVGGTSPSSGFPSGPGQLSSLGLRGTQSRGGWDSMLTHPLRAWGGEWGAEGMEVRCHPELTVTWGASLVRVSARSTI